ncbi:hypothetical protein LdCL_340010300 [Leishmania donovani]|uniref:Secreted protein n=1 Tax=Leishmania donovani TaxID=5661 RepID=A0A3Q8IE50_LEIDO|nr:hypothetical protein LdCL_340010300 [Leishmania donovani]
MVLTLIFTVADILVLTELLALRAESSPPRLLQCRTGSPHKAATHRGATGLSRSVSTASPLSSTWAAITERSVTFPDHDTTVPYMVLPVTVEETLMVLLMRIITVHIRHAVHVQNGALPSMMPSRTPSPLPSTWHSACA